MDPSDLLVAKIIVAALSLVLLAFLSAAGLGQYLDDRRTGGGGVADRATYVRLPILLPFMALSLVAMVTLPLVAYPIIGALWGLLLPVRLAIRMKLVQQMKYFPVGTALDPGAWFIGFGLVVIHGLFWPISVPAFYYLGNVIGDVY